MRKTIITLILLVALILSVLLTSCGGVEEGLKEVTMSTEQTVPAIDTIVYEKIETATFAMG